MMLFDSKYLSWRVLNISIEVLSEGRKVARALNNVWKKRRVATEAKMGMYSGIEPCTCLSFMARTRSLFS